MFEEEVEMQNILNTINFVSRNMNKKDKFSFVYKNRLSQNSFRAGEEGHLIYEPQT